MRVCWKRFGLSFLLAAWLLSPPDPVRACSCAWAGAFLQVAPQAESIIRARILRYHGKGDASRQPLAMDVKVLEVVDGKVDGPKLRIWGDDGHLCRPYVTQFPVGTEWILALNGPGSKPGMSPGPSISACGTYWLRVVGDTAVGNVDDLSERETRQVIPLDDLRQRLACALRERGAASGRARIEFQGEISAGEAFERPFGPGFLFRLAPSPLGWRIVVTKQGRDEDLSRLTPPFHFVPNPRDIEGWHFRNTDNTGPNEPGEKNVNAPGMVREFIFSPEVGREIAGPGAAAAPTAEEIERVRRFGEGALQIEDLRLTDLEPGHQARIGWMRFRVEIRWSGRSGSETNQD